VLLFGFLYTALDKSKTRILIPVVFLSVIVIANLGSLAPKAFVENNVRVLTTPLAYNSELFRVYPTMMGPLASYLQRDYIEGDIFWVNNYRDILTVRSGIPHFSPVCDLGTGVPLGPESVANREHIRWFIFFQYDPRLPQDLRQEPCLGEEWQKRLESAYTKSMFVMPRGYYVINDPDIVGRRIPLTEAKPNQVIIYEKKTYLVSDQGESLP
jgi:hypothetical protein